MFIQDSAPDVWPAKVKITVAIALPRYVDLAQACMQLIFLACSKRAEEHILRTLLEDDFDQRLEKELAFYRYSVAKGSVQQGG